MRYSRNILIEDIGEEGQKKIATAKVLICGCGGLGSGVITNLASLGVGGLGLVDRDVVEVSNLNRQFVHTPQSLGNEKVLSAKSWINAFNPEINVETFYLKLDLTNYEKIVADYDILVDCFDSFESKFLLNKIAILTGKPLVHGGITEYFGQVTTVIKGKTPCLNCIIQEPDLNSYIAKGVISPAVTLISSIESLEVTRLILGQKPELAGFLLSVNCKDVSFKKLKLTTNFNCKTCAAEETLLSD